MKTQIYELLKAYRLSDKVCAKISNDISGMYRISEISAFITGIIAGIVIAIAFMILNTKICYIP